MNVFYFIYVLQENNVGKRSFDTNFLYLKINFVFL